MSLFGHMVVVVICSYVGMKTVVSGDRGTVIFGGRGTVIFGGVETVIFGGRGTVILSRMRKPIWVGARAFLHD